MDQTTDAIRQDIDATRDSMTDKIELIESRVKEQVDDTVQSVKGVFDIREHVDQRPWLSLGTSLVVGAVIGSLDRPDARPYDRWRDDNWRAPGTSGYGDRGQGASSMFAQAPAAIAEVRDQVVDRIGDELDVVKVALVATLADMARDWLNNQLPEFGTQFERALNERRGSTPVPAPMPAAARSNGAANSSVPG